MFKYRRKYLALFVFIMYLVNLTGCFPFDNKQATIAGVNQKLELAVKYLAEKKFERAVLAYNQVIKIDSKNVVGYKGLGLAYVMQNNFVEAEKVLKQGLKELPGDERLQLAMAGLMLDQGNLHKAEAIYKQVLAQDNCSIQAYQGYSDYLVNAGRIDEAISLLEPALASDNKQYQLDSLLARLYVKNGDKDKALATINRSLTSEPNQSEAYKQLAELYEDNWPELIALGDTYIKSGLKNGIAFKLTGLYCMNRYTDMIKEYQQLGQDTKGIPVVRIIIAQAYRKTGSLAKSRDIIDSIKLVDIKDAGMLADIAGFYLDSGDKLTARKVAMQGIKADKSTVENYVVMYRSYLGEDQLLAKVWGYKFLTAGVSSYVYGFNQLTDLGINLGIDLKADNLVSYDSQFADRMAKVVFSPKKIRIVKSKHYPPGSVASNKMCYFDASKNIAYGGILNAKGEPDEANVVRIHNPKIIPFNEVPEAGPGNSYLSRAGAEHPMSKAIRVEGLFSGGSSYYAGIWVEGNDFEGDLKKAGIDTNYIVYFDVYQ